MKKKILLLATIGVIGLCIVALGKPFLGTKPFRGLSVNDISDVTVSISSFRIGTTFTANSNEIKELVEILQKVVTYKQDNSHVYTDYSEHAAVFTINKVDGTQIYIRVYTFLIIINGNGYETKYEPCEELVRLANNLESSKDR